LLVVVVVVVVVVVLLDPFCLNAEYKRTGGNKGAFIPPTTTDDSPSIAARFRTTHL